MMTTSEKRFRQLGKKLHRQDALMIGDDEGGFALVKGGDKAGKQWAKISAAMQADWLKADLIEAHDEGYRLSAVGRAHLRRHTRGHASGGEASGDFAAQHALDETPSAMHGAPRKLASTPLQWLQARGRSAALGLNDMELEAGGRLHDDFHRAARTPHQTMDWSRPVYVDGGASDGGGDIGAAILDAQNRVAKALAYVGPGLADMAVDVCCAELGLEATETKFALPRRSAKIMLKLALMRLSVHYGYQSASAAAASFRMR